MIYTPKIPVANAHRRTCISAARVLFPLLAGVAASLLGCLGGGPAPLEYVAGGTGAATVLRSQASVEVLTPVSDLSIAGGTQVEVNWRAFARTTTSVLNVIVDEDEDPNNDNEIIIFSSLPLTESTVLIDTTRLARGTYFVGVTVIEVGDIVAVGYASGRIIIDERPTLFFEQVTDPNFIDARRNVTFDRTDAINPRFRVAWQISDPDSTNTVEVYLDPDDSPNGNEILLYRSASQTGDAFNFELPTKAFQPGTYRILALASDGVNSFPFYAPGRIRLRARVAGAVDLRDLQRTDSELRGAVFEGFNPRDNAGSFISSAGDIDNDGFGDFLILAQFGKPQYSKNTQRTGVGEAYLIYGRSDPFRGVLDLNSTGSLFRGDIFTGVPEASDPIRPSRGITSFTALSDWDFDGIRELAFGLPFTDSLAVAEAELDADGYFRSGVVVVASGTVLRPDLGFPGLNVINLADIGTLPHVSRTCGICTDDDACPCVEGFIGPKAPAIFSGCGGTYFHQHTSNPDETSRSFGGRRLGCRLSSNVVGDQFGETVSTGDFDSIIMCAPNRDPLISVQRLNESVPGAGVISVFFNDVKRGFYPWSNENAPAANSDFNYVGTRSPADLPFLPHGGPYHYIIDDYTTLPEFDAATPGYRVDVGDSVPCELVAAGGIARGNSLRIWSSTPGARLSNATSAGDVNGDGLLDICIGAPLAVGDAGAGYLVFGRVRDLIWGGELQIEELGLPLQGGGNSRIFDGIRILGRPGDRLGQSVASAGDFNNDGFSDVVIASPQMNNRFGGAAVFMGSRDAINQTQADIPYDELPERGLGVVFVGESVDDLCGARVASAGDVDGDGSDDILIAAPNRSERRDINGDGQIDLDRQNCGAVYLVYGGPNLIQQRTPGGKPGILELRYVGTQELPGAVFFGRNSGDFLGAGLGIQGDRSTGIAGAGDVDGDGAEDLLISAVSAAPRNRAFAGETYLLYGTLD